MTPTPSDPNFAPAEDSIKVGNSVIPCSDVEAIIGEPGVNFARGWRRNTVIARGRRYTAKDHPLRNLQLFAQWMEACPRAVGVMPDGSLKLPRVEPRPGEDPMEIIRTAVQAAARALRDLAIKLMVWAGLIVVLGIALGWGAIATLMKFPQDELGIRLLGAGVVVSVGGVVVAGRGVALLWRRRNLVKILRHQSLHGEVEVEGVAAAVALARPWQVSFIPGSFAILSLCLMIFPILGLVVSVVAMALNYRRATWARKASIVGLCVSGAITLIVCATW